ncbi:MAG: aminotransferase class V-fold PLP-dependent enzyme [Betaproteobacteria bacterium]
MNAPERRPSDAVDVAVVALGPGPLTEVSLQTHIAPLFSRVRAAFRDTVYLANHSLGRPLNAGDDDVREGMAAWYGRLDDAWTPWSAEMQAFRTRLGQLLNAPRQDCVVPRTSAGQGLRAILNTFDATARVVATRGEFDSLDVILREYARRGRVELTLVEPRDDDRFDTADILGAIGSAVDLVVVSQVMFTTGQRLSDLPDIVTATHRAGGRLLLDVYHALAVFPVDVTALDVDFAVGGSYKYLRGGPGACFLYLHPRHLDGSLRTLDTGWFAKRDPFSYARPDPPLLGNGGDAFLESTPPVLPFYQARAGQRLALALGVERLRVHSLDLQLRLTQMLCERGFSAQGGTQSRGAFVVVCDDRAEAWADQLRGARVIADARGRYLRLCPDLLTTQVELIAAADALSVIRSQHA